MNTENKPSYRYPGTKPFEPGDSMLFYGREDDIRNLLQQVLLQNLLVLYGRSGLGKSSLLNAGLVNELKKDESVVTLNIRFGAYLPGTSEMPVNKLQGIISEQYPGSGGSFLYKKIIPAESVNSHHLWYLFKSIHITDNAKATFVLIFDQFEELFTYPAAEVQLFAKELAELFFVSIPQQLRNIITDKIDADEEDITEDELRLLYDPFKIKFLFSIRSDKLSLLNNLSESFPGILQHCYELKPLNRNQAKQAIEAPAKLEGNFLSEPFGYTEGAITGVLDELCNSHESKNYQQQEIETFQLQIVCKHVENIVIETKDDCIDENELGNIKEIFENHYRNIIAKLAPADQLPARQLLEEKLIIDGVRVSMPLAFILREPGITLKLVNQLVETHIVRPEQNNTIEISHDTLVQPILNFYDERRKNELIQKEIGEKEKQFAETLAAQQQSQRRARRKSVRLLQVAGLIVLAVFTTYLIFQRNATANILIAYKYGSTAQGMKDTNPTRALNVAYASVKKLNDDFIVNSAFDLLYTTFFYKDVIKVEPGSFISFSKDQSRVITGSPAGKNIIWDLEGKALDSFTSKSRLRAADFFENRILTGQENGDVDIHTTGVAGGQRISQNAVRIKDVRFAHDGKQVFILLDSVKQAPGLQLQVMDLNGKINYTYGNGDITCFYLLNDGSLLAGEKNNRLTHLTNTLKRKTNINRRVPGIGSIISISGTDDGYFVTLSTDGTLSEWDGISSDEPALTYTEESKCQFIYYVYSDVSKTQNFIFVGTKYTKGVHDSADRKKAYNPKDVHDSQNEGGAVIHDKGSVNVWLYNDDSIYQKMLALKGHQETVTDMLYRSKDNRMFTASLDGTVKRWIYISQMIENAPRSDSAFLSRKAVTTQDKIKVIDWVMKSNNIMLMDITDKDIKKNKN